MAPEYKCVNRFVQGCKEGTDACPCKMYKTTSNIDPHFVYVTFCKECAFWSRFLPKDGKKRKCIISGAYRNPKDYCSTPKKL